LTDKDQSLKLMLSSTSSQPVRYRVVVSGPHLSIAAPRGEFTGSATLELTVDTSRLKGIDAPGSIRVITSLGEFVVDAPVHVGLTGRYHGSMRYDSGSIGLGEAALTVDLVDVSGQLVARIDPDHSLLFPRMPGAQGLRAVTGTGTFTKGDNLADLTFQQRVGAQYGGARNLFGRDLVRVVHLLLHPGVDGALQGQFTDEVYGLFAQSSRREGSVSLELVAGSDPGPIDAAVVPIVPPNVVIGPFLQPRDVFGWTDDGGVSCFNIAAAACGANSDCRANPAPYAVMLETSLAAPLQSGMQTNRSSLPFSTLADSCRQALTLSGEAAQTDVSKQCGMVAPLACLLDIAANHDLGPDDVSGKLFGRVVADVAGPALLVANEEVVEGLNDSFDVGLTAEATHYDRALTALQPVGRWLLQPPVLEHLRTLSAAAAKGDEPAASDPRTEHETYASARALADIFYGLATIDGERARIAAASQAGEQPALAQQVQEHALLGYLEAVSLGTIIDTWQTVPQSVGARAAGMLSVLNRGFSALVQGANIFGIPAGFVPFIYRPEDVGRTGPTNFEQMVAIASMAVASEKQAEDDYRAHRQQFEQSNATLQQELSQIRTQFDLRLSVLCGAAFNPNIIFTDDDWAKCGANDDGDVGAKQVQVRIARNNISEVQARIEAKRSQIQVSVRTTAEIYQLREQDISFMSDTGQAVNAISLTEGVMDAITHALTVASNANLWNGFSSIAEAAVVGIIDGVKADLDYAKAELLLAQSLHSAQTNADVERLKAWEGIQREVIELGEMAVELHGALLASLLAEVDVRNAIEEAKSVFAERGRALDVYQKDPSHDPSYRLIRDRRALDVIRARAEAQRELDLAGDALAYELNMSLADVDGAVLNASDGFALGQLASCFTDIYNQYRLSFGSPQEYVTTISVRKLLGVSGPRTDAVTGETLDEGRQFREYLLRNDNLDGNGGVGIRFSTTLQPNNGLWSSDTCSDRITSLQAQLVGDFLGSNEKKVHVVLDGTGVMRACDSDAITLWSMGKDTAQSGPALAVVQAGVNTFGDAPPNTSLFGQPVARATWHVEIPGGSVAPENADIDLSHIDDIALRVTHRALPRQTVPWQPDLSCLANH
jgi:hypothetical protein